MVSNHRSFSSSFPFWSSTNFTISPRGFSFSCVHRRVICRERFHPFHRCLVTGPLSLITPSAPLLEWLSPTVRLREGALITQDVVVNPFGFSYKIFGWNWQPNKCLSKQNNQRWALPEALCFVCRWQNCSDCFRLEDWMWLTLLTRGTG